jgi:hypothetical protein
MIGAHSDHPDTEPTYQQLPNVPAETQNAKRILPELIPLIEDPDAVNFEGKKVKNCG